MQEMPGAGMEAGQAARRGGEDSGGKKSYKERIKPWREDLRVARRCLISWVRHRPSGTDQGLGSSLEWSANTGWIKVR